MLNLNATSNHHTQQPSPSPRLLLSRPSPLSSSQRMIYDCQQHASLHIVVIVWKEGSSHSAATTNVLSIRALKWTLALIVVHVIAMHIVWSRSTRSVQFQCKSGRSLIAFGRIFFISVLYADKVKHYVSGLGFSSADVPLQHLLL